jgi:hypothetical protein
MRSSVKPLILLLALVSISIFLISCTSNSSVQARFVNAIYNPGSYGNTVDVEFNSTKEFSQIGFPDASASTYKGVPGGSVTVIGLESSNDTTQVFDQTETLNGGTDYTLVASGTAGGSGNPNVVFNPYADNNTAPATSTVNFRVINASDVATSVDVYVEPLPFTGTLGQNGVTPTFTVPINTQSSYVNLNWNSNGGGWGIYVTPAGNPGLIYVNGFPVTGGGTGTDAIRTIVLTDNADTPNSLDSQLLVLNDLN